MRIVARLLVLLPLLWVVLCASAYGAEQIDQITLERAGSDDSVDALRESDRDAPRAKAGDTLVLRLAVSGRYEIAIDQARLSSLGNTIIRGTTPSGGKSLMVIGADGSVRGHFERPDEVVQVSSDEDGVVTAWIEGVDVEMLPINDEDVVPTDDTLWDSAEPSIEELSDSAIPKASETAEADVSYARFKTGQATIRILIYYEDTMNAIATVADYLVELANLAFETSDVSATLVIAGLEPVALEPSPSLADVLDLMKAAEAPFDYLEEDLSAENADLAATLVGSANSETTSGIARTGGKFSTERLSVTRYRGYQDGNSLYPAYSFAHEIGHNLGAKHNREQYANNGQDLTNNFSYAFGYLIDGVQRTIMSYRSEAYGDETRIPRFSNPSIFYDGYTTGISTWLDDSAFVARVLANNRHVAAGTNDFAYEQIRYESVLSTGGECGSFRGMRIRNESGSVISLESRSYVKSDGSVTYSQFSPPYQLEPDTSKSNGYCRPESDTNPLGTTYVESFYRYYHPTTGELVEGPRFQWSETYIAQSELRIAHTDGGEPIGNTVRMIPIGEEVDILFETDRGFSLEEIMSTCEGFDIDDGFSVTSTIDPCLLEASFTDNRTPPAKPLITDIQTGDGIASISVTVSDDGGADITAISGICTFEDSTYSGQSESSPVSVGEMINGLTYECSVRATNLKGTGAASDTVAVALPQTMPSAPTVIRTDNGDGEVFIFVSDSGQTTTLDSYTATCTDGTNTLTGTSTSSPITVSGLTNGVAYTCTVTATNSVGISSASAATDPITPEETSTGLPIWLLYQATQ